MESRDFLSADREILFFLCFPNAIFGLPDQRLSDALTLSERNPIVHSMLRRLIAGSIVAIWLLLLAIDFSGDGGLIQNYRGSESDRAVDSVLTGYGQVTLVSSDALVAISPTPVSEPAYFFSSPKNYFPTDWTKSELLFPKDEIPIYKLRLVFLI
jgi:hypothetical protein